MLGLVEGILDVTAVARGHVAINLEPVDIPNLIGELSKGYSLLAKDKQLGFILETEGGHIITDPLRLSQIVDNLVSNALKFSAPGGQVALRAVVMDRELCIEVEDHGPGIEDSQLALLFEYFRTGQAHSTGGEKRYGIGLAVVRALVDALGGRITVRSKTGEGSTFTVILPEGGLRSVESTGP
jgi:signal transduction histidine kinase